MRHGSELSQHLLHQLVDHAGATARDVRRMRRQVDDLALWLKRMALLLTLYGSGLAMLLLSDEKAEIVIRLVKAWRSG